MTATLSLSQRDSIIRILETTSTPKTDIARRFNCSRQTIIRIDKESNRGRSLTFEQSEQMVAAKRELDSAFSAFERCNSRDNYRRLDEARYRYECVVGRLSKSPSHPATSTD